MSLQIKGRPIGDGFPCYVTFEAGPTHSGLDSAVELVEIAALAGGDAIKFQIIDSARLVSNQEQLFSYLVLEDRKTGHTKQITESLYQILKRRELSENQWKKVKQHADDRGLAFFVTIAFEDQLEFAQQLGVDSIKIASSDINYFPLIRAAARTGLCVQLDTGNASLGEVEQAVNALVAEGNSKIVIHHCPSGYPAQLDGINLRILKTLKAMFECPVAYSDHSPGWEMDIAAVALGANMVEKTITLDRTTPSVEHMFSLEGNEPAEFVFAMQNLDLAMGKARKILSDEEIQKRDSTRRSAFVRKTIEEGTPIDIEHIEFRRPGYGFTPQDLPNLIDRVAKKRIEVGNMLKPEDIFGN
jgi:sialic acid synthase SpsE